MTQSYEYASGYRINQKIQAKIVGEILEKIEKRDNTITPEAVIEEAKPKKSPIHGCFNWDDAKAANEYRLWQARNLIRSVVIIKEDREPEKRFAYIPGEEGNRAKGGYKTIDLIVQDISEYDRALTFLSTKIGELNKAIGDLKAAAARESEKKGIDFTGKIKLVEIFAKHMQAAQAIVSQLSH